MTELLSNDEFYEGSRDPDMLQAWVWALAESGQRDAWWWQIGLDEQDGSVEEMDRPYPFRLCIRCPGGLSFNLGTFLADVPIQCSSQARTIVHGWLVPTSYGAWEFSYEDDDPAGSIALRVYADEDEADEEETAEPVSWFRGIPRELVVELGACLSLPPAAWPLREGWMERRELLGMRRSRKGLEPPI